jgi:hypothetical protein
MGSVNMRVCGVEISGNDAIISLLSQNDGIFNIPECRVSRVTCQNPDRVEDLRYLQKTFLQLVQDYKIDLVVIRERMKKGKFAGGANGFKIEAALQLTPGLSSMLMTSTDLKAHLKHYPMPIAFAETGLKKFQEPSFTTAFAYFASKHKW